MEDYSLQADGVAKSFAGVPALKQGQIHVRKGSVHALCGGNGAGKSTFLSILTGIIRKDEGRIVIAGKEVDFRSPKDAIEGRIAIVTQELTAVPHLTVAENIFLNREPRLAGLFLHRQQLVRMAGDIITRLGFEIDPAARMCDLPLAQIQLVEIIKALSHEADIVIMDEPTSAIGEHETHVLFDAIRRLKQRGVSIIYVTHRLAEIFEIADEYTVFRDGQFVETGLVGSIDKKRLVQLIVGRTVEDHVADQGRELGAVVLRTEALTREGEFTGVSIDVREGEVFGIYGLMGSGRTEFLNCVYGITRAQSGAVFMSGKRLPPGRPHASIDAKMAMVPEDRKVSGVILKMAVGQNITISALHKFTRGLFLRFAAEHRLVVDYIDRLRIKTASASLPVQSMSGGNQQKVAIARCLLVDPKLLIFDEPTRGIDEGSKQEIYQLIDDFARQGGAVIVVSSEAPEILQVSRRIAIFKAGRLVETVEGDSLSQENLLHLAA